MTGFNCPYTDFPSLFDYDSEEFDEVNGAFSEIDLFGQPACSLSSTMEESIAFTGQLDTVTDDGSKLSMVLNVLGFQQDELKVSLIGQSLNIEGKQEIKEGSSFTSRSFLHRWNLPENVDLEQIRAAFTVDGQLTIEAPKKSY